MARQWPVGEVLNGSLADVLKGEALRRVRREIYEETWLPRVNAACSPYCYQTCSPDLSCPCNPLLCQQSCAPWDAQIQSE
jgi:hypothetical protein